MEMAYVLTHATVLDGTEQMGPQPNMTVVVDDGGRIDRVGPAASTVGPLGAREIDLGGAYLMPGLINAHVHLCGSGKPMSAGGAGDLIDKVVGNPLGMWALRRMIRGHAQAQLASGVTTVRSVGDPGFADVDVRDAIDAGKCAGPRLLTSGVGVTVPGGHGAELDDELIALFKKNGVGRASSLTCTVSPALPFVELAPEKTKSTEVQKVNGRIVYEGIVRAAQQALAAGIPVGLGTDSSCPYITHYDLWREVVYFERLVGASRQMALHTATLGNARILGLGEETGSVEEGKAADLIVTKANPLENLEALRDVSMVMVRGKLDEHPRVKRIPELDAELDEFLPKAC